MAAPDRGLQSVPRGLDRNLTTYLQAIRTELLRLSGLVRGSDQSRAVRASEASAAFGGGSVSTPSGSVDVAAIASHSCVALYGLERLAADIQDRSNNYTRFICISKKLEIYPGADKTSLMVVLPHRPGSLYQILARFYALGLNLIKLESRPLPDREFEFMFYFDLETSVYSDEFIRMVDDLSAVCEEFQYLGSYSEVI